jgi:O-antigen ligase
LAVAGLPLIQVIPLSDRMLTAIAPVSAGAWKVANQGDPALFGCISIDPAATVAAARWLLLSCGMIAVVADVGRDSRGRKWLTAALATTGVLLLTLGVLFPVTKDNHSLLGIISLDGPLEFWRTPVEPPIRTSGWGYLEWLTVRDQRYQNDLSVTGDGFATYINSNHFAGAIGLTLPFAWGWLCSLAFWRLPPWASRLIAAALWVAGLCIVGLLAHSRAGCASLLLAGLLFFTLQIRAIGIRKLLAGATAAYTAFLIACVVALVGRFVGIVQVFPEALRPAFTTALNDGRALAASAGAKMFSAAPFLGTGLGSYDELYQKLMPGGTTLYFAHNDYVQLLAESGLVGMTVALLLVAVLCRHFVSFARMPIDADTALRAAPWAALAAIGAHSAFDFNLQVPANAFLAAVVAGLALATTPTPPRDRLTAIHRRGLMPALPGIGLAIACTVALGFMARDAFSDATIRYMRLALVGETATAIPPKDQAAADRMEEAIAAGEQAYRYDQSNPRLALLISRLHLHLATVAPASNASLTHLAESRAWGTKASRNCPACRGMPEPAPAPAPKLPDKRIP